MNLAKNCSIVNSPDGNDIVFLGENGNFSSRVFGGAEKHSMQVDGGNEIIFSENGNRMHIAVDSGSSSGLYIQLRSL